ncbi:DNA-binding transcriptional activator of the SARP family [Lentzea xinjiangensis]|uniref:DNA-binding transcriptional activator of the SARP family n=1 Tax=Lentzea xinjiangensis TaxID=402600 RepID=A0A1H9GVY5_9PSEU|nr:BTAD domain-containing putative transcriptional regulator [Lentzea xinjiangensis]SEQ54188.1 DNA-binding transcriptional activator of the SARP family [Lentzea xinjiangensis]
MQNELRVSLLGALAATVDGEELTLGPPRQRAVLAVLALRANHVVSRSELIDAVWGDEPPASADNGIHTYVAGLRRLFEPGRASRAPSSVLLSTDAGYLLKLPPDSSDVALFRTYLDEAGRVRDRPAEAVAAFDRALGLWRGVALDGVPGPFAAVERARLAELRLTAVEQRAALMLSLGREAEVAAELTTLVSAHPLRERLYGLLMSALYRGGRQAEALAVYADLRRLLVEELGIEPGPELRGLHEQLLVGLPDPQPEPVAPALVPVQLPHEVRDFTGREKELARLADAVPVDHSPVLVAITGTGGVGKTALAVRFAHQVASRFPDGQLHVDLRGFDASAPPVRPAAALHQLLQSLGVPAERVPEDLPAKSALYRSVLANKRVLVLLDNARLADQVRPLLPGRSASMVLVTSRNHLGGLVARDGAHSMTLSTLTRDEGLALLTAAVGADRVAAEPAAAAKLVELCGHLPLAIRIAAERVVTRPHLTLADLAGDLADERDRLNVLATGDDEDTAVRAAFSWSYLALKPDAARTFRLIGLHPGAEIGLAAVAALTGVPVPRARALLDVLASGHMVEEVARGRFRLHDLLRLYATELSATEESFTSRDEAVERLLRWYFDKANAAGTVIGPPDHPAFLLPPLSTQDFASHDEAFTWCRAESANLAAVAKLAEDQHSPTAWQIPVALWNYFIVSSALDEWTDTYRVAERAAARDGNQAARAWAIHGQGLAAFRGQRFADALELFDRALAIRREIGDRVGAAWSLTGLGMAYGGLRRFDLAADRFGEALERHAEVGSWFGEGGTRLFLSDILRSAGQHEESLASARRAFEVMDSHGAVHGKAMALVSIGWAQAKLGHRVEARDSFRDALGFLRVLGDRKSLAEALHGLGEMSTGQPEVARTHLLEALTIYEDYDHPLTPEVRARLHELA